MGCAPPCVRRPQTRRELCTRTSLLAAMAATARCDDSSEPELTGTDTVLRAASTFYRAPALAEPIRPHTWMAWSVKP